MFVGTFMFVFFFFFNDTATTEIYTLSLHDALPIVSLDLVERPLELRCDEVGQFVRVVDLVGQVRELAIAQQVVQCGERASGDRSRVGGEQARLAQEEHRRHRGSRRNAGASPTVSSRSRWVPAQSERRAASLRNQPASVNEPRRTSPRATSRAAPAKSSTTFGTKTIGACNCSKTAHHWPSSSSASSRCMRWRSARGGPGAVRSRSTTCASGKSRLSRSTARGA